MCLRLSNRCMDRIKSFILISQQPGARWKHQCVDFFIKHLCGDDFFGLISFHFIFILFYFECGAQCFPMVSEIANAYRVAGALYFNIFKMHLTQRSIFRFPFL